MKLPFGVHNDYFIHISEVPSGRTNLRCPYCNGALVAKKGRIKRHHFAHEGTGCTTNFANHFFDLVGRLPTRLPLSVYVQQKLARIDQFQQKLQAEKRRLQPTYAEEKLAILKNKLSEIAHQPHEGNIPDIQKQVNRFV
ncbi:MAG: hypothetical protein AAGJ18_24400, partial [Bacteroidota bacterium]